MFHRISPIRTGNHIESRTYYLDPAAIGRYIFINFDTLSQRCFISAREGAHLRKRYCVSFKGAPNWKWANEEAVTLAKAVFE